MIIHNPMIDPISLAINDRNNLFMDIQSGKQISVVDQDIVTIWNEQYQDITIKINGINANISATSYIKVDKNGWITK